MFSNINWISILSFLLFASTLTGCLTYEEVDIQGIEKYKIDKIQKDKVYMLFDVKIHNPNGYAINVKTSQLDLTMNGNYMGTCEIDGRLKIKPKRTEVYTVPVVCTTQNTLSAGLFAAIQLFSGKKTEFNIKGKIKARTSVFNRRFDVDITESL